jgi:hypothetical protein
MNDFLDRGITPKLPVVITPTAWHERASLTSIKRP